MQSNRKVLDIKDRRSSQFQGKSMEIEQPESLKEEPEEGYIPISLLHPFKENWSIKARVTRKGDLKEWKNAKSTGQVFNADLMDQFNTEITCTFYNEAAKKYHSLLQQEQVYILSDGRINFNKSKQYNKPNDHIIIFDQEAKITLDQGPSNIKAVHLSPLPISKIVTLKETSHVFDVLAVVIDEGSS